MKMKVTRLETLSTIAQSPEYRGAHNQASKCFFWVEKIPCDLFCDTHHVGFYTQCYKVVFSMHLLGDPSLYAYQVKTGVTDLFVKTREYPNLQIWLRNA